MKAIIWTRYDPPEVTQLKEVDKPVPAVDEVFIKVAANVFPGDGETHRFQIHPRWQKTIIYANKKDLTHLSKSEHDG